MSLFSFRLGLHLFKHPAASLPGRHVRPPAARMAQSTQAAPSARDFDVLTELALEEETDPHAGPGEIDRLSLLENDGKDHWTLEEACRNIL